MLQNNKFYIKFINLKIINTLYKHGELYRRIFNMGNPIQVNTNKVYFRLGAKYEKNSNRPHK